MDFKIDEESNKYIVENNLIESLTYVIANYERLKKRQCK